MGRVCAWLVSGDELCQERRVDSNLGAVHVKHLVETGEQSNRPVRDNVLVVQGKDLKVPYCRKSHFHSFYYCKAGLGAL